MDSGIPKSTMPVFFTSKIYRIPESQLPLPPSYRCLVFRDDAFLFPKKFLQIQANGNAPEVNTTSGTIVGKLETLSNGKTVYEYLGIPYAEAPVKKYRWAAPRPPKNWTGTKETKEFGAACPQPDVNITNFKEAKRNGKMNKVLLIFERCWTCIWAVRKGDWFIHKFSTLCCKNI